MRTLMFLTGFLATLTLTAHAATLTPQKTYYPQDFYTQVENGVSGSTLKKVLFDILSSAHISTGGQDQLAPNCDNKSSCRKHFSLGYTAARKIMFGKLHLQETSHGYAIFDVYCEKLTTENDMSGQPPAPGQIPDSSVLNAEHTWPQSHFTSSFPRDLQKSDLHILFPVLSYANSSRGNLPFGEVVTETTSPCAQSRRGYAKDGGGKQYFEPPDHHKGNVARALFYFSVRYQIPIKPDEEASLRAWNRLDPVDDFERHRNDMIDEEQNDRNPFIDYPELADLIADF